MLTVTDLVPQRTHYSNPYFLALSSQSEGDEAAENPSLTFTKLVRVPSSNALPAVKGFATVGGDGVHLP